MRWQENRKLSLEKAVLVQNGMGRCGSVHVAKRGYHVENSADCQDRQGREPQWVSLGNLAVDLFSQHPQA